MTEYENIPVPFLSFIRVYEDIHGVMLKDMQKPKNSMHKNRRDGLISGAHGRGHTHLVIARSLRMPISEVKAIVGKRETPIRTTNYERLV